MYIYGFVYLITNLLNNMKYVGQTTRTLEQRFTEHAKSDSLLGKAIRKYGRENFSIEVLEVCDSPEMLNERECFWIAKLNCKYPNGYNTMSGGQYIRTHSKNKADFVPTKKEIILRQIGAKIAYYRTLRQMTQAELAKKVNLSRSSIVRIERGKYNNGVPISTLLDIAEGLRIDLSALVTFSEEEKKVWWEIDKHML